MSPLPQVGPDVPGGQPAPAVRRVLVVDDDERTRQAVATILTAEGYLAHVAADGEEAMSVFASWQPDLVLTDLNMPRLDGQGLLLRVHRERPGTPVIVLSARGGQEERASVESLGAVGFFSKPVQIDALLARIHDLIGP